MSKYDPLWEWIQKNEKDSCSLTFAQIEQIAGVPIDHSFLKYKKELLPYGYQVSRISLKSEIVVFERLSE